MWYRNIDSASFSSVTIHTSDREDSKERCQREYEKFVLHEEDIQKTKNHKILQKRSKSTAWEHIPFISAASQQRELNSAKGKIGFNYFLAANIKLSKN